MHVLIKRQGNIYSQEYGLNVHPSCLNKPSSKSETGGVSKVDHGLGEGEGDAVHMGLFQRVPEQRMREKRSVFDTCLNCCSWILCKLCICYLTKSSYLYGTLRFSWYKDSNFGSLAREATVRIFSIASVAICRDTTHVTLYLISSIHHKVGVFSLGKF